VSDSQLLILYIEDDPISRKVMEFMLLRVIGVSQVAIFEDTANFLEQLRALPAVPRVAFVDIHVGPLSGFEVLSFFREQPEYKHLPVIAMTASVTSLDTQEIKRAGFDGLIGKPINSQTFPDLLKQILVGERVWFI
jgi:CheY-like chemotaxis protein